MKKSVTSLFLFSLLIGAEGQINEVQTKGFLKFSPIDSNRVLKEMKLSREVHKKNPEGGEQYNHAQKAIDYALAYNDTLLYARAIDNLGLLYRFNQQYSQAISLHSKAFEMIKNMPGQPVYKMIFANNAGVAARYFEKYDLSVLYYLAALKLAEKENDLKNIAISSNGLGNALGNIPERQEEALAFFNRALEVEKLRNNELGVAMNYLSISDYYIEKKEFNTSRKYLAKLKEVNKKRNDEYGLAMTDEFYGLSFLKEGIDYNRSLDYFKMSLDRFRKIKDVQKQAELLSSMARVSEKQENSEQALNYYIQSMNLAKVNHSKGLIMANAERLAHIYEGRNNLQKALEYYKVARVYKDSIDLSQQLIQVAALTTRYDIEKKESRIELLENEKQLRKEQLSFQHEKIKKQQILFLLFGVLAVSILLISIIQNKASKNKKRSVILLANQEKERLQAIYERDLAQAEMLAARMQINPHFLFNCLNAINYLIQKGENEKATKYLVLFSRFVRMVLESSESHVVPLEEELSLIRHYLKLEENRFDQKFTYHITVDDSERIKEILIPPLLLQPFVENAILHGLLPSKKDSKELHILVSFSNNTTEICIEDNGIGYKNDKSIKTDNRHKSMGTKITADRINHYNKNYQSQIGCKTEVYQCEKGFAAGTRVSVTLTNTAQLHTPTF